MERLPRVANKIEYGRRVLAAGSFLQSRGGVHGELPRAFVTLRPGATATPEELIGFCGTRLARYKVPRLVEVRDELPLTLVGKVVRHRLAQEPLPGG